MANKPYICGNKGPYTPGCGDLCDELEYRVEKNEECCRNNTNGVEQNANDIDSLEDRMYTAEGGIERNTELIDQLILHGGGSFSIRKSLYTTTQGSESTIPIGINDFSASDDTLIVYISGLALNENEYTISGTNIVLTTPITTVETEVQFVAYRGSVVVDPTLTVSGAAADAKVTGDRTTDLKADLNAIQPIIDDLTYTKEKIEIITDKIIQADGSLNDNENCMTIYFDIDSDAYYKVHNINTYFITANVAGFDVNGDVVANGVSTVVVNGYTVFGYVIKRTDPSVVRVGVGAWKKGFTISGRVCNKDPYVTSVAQNKIESVNADIATKTQYPFISNVFDKPQVITYITMSGGVATAESGDLGGFGYFPVSKSDQILLSIDTTQNYNAFGSRFITYFDSGFNYVSQAAYANSFIVPSGVSYAWINVFLSDLDNININVIKANTPNIKIDERALPTISGTDYNAYKIYATIEDDVAEMTFKYNSAYDMTVQMQKQGGLNEDYEPVGGNQLFDFCRWFLTANMNRAVTDTPDTSTAGKTVYEDYYINGTDFFGPYRVRAVNNADGDKATNNDYTGGNHQYNNTSSGSTATARTANLVFRIDGRNVTSFAGYCKEVVIEWDNFIQGNNTKKANGTGREILKEHHTVRFDGDRFYVENQITALEELYIYTYYGLQMTMQYAHVNYDAFLFLGSKTMKSVQKPPATPNMKYSGDKASRDIINFNNWTGSLFYKSNREMHVENEGLGDFEYVKSIPSSCRASAGKLYFELIEAYDESTYAIDMDKILTLQANDVIYFRGWYKFYPQN